MNPQMQGMAVNTKKFERELTVEVEVEDTKSIAVMDLLKGVKKECGEILGCRMKTDKKFEITMKDGAGKAKLIDGIRINGVPVIGRDIMNSDMVVSFLNLPVYLEDSTIMERLNEWGVRPLSAIKRRVWPGTDIADGTRFLKVRFNEQVRSLPYSTKFETMRGVEYFRVIHDRQIQVCRKCIKPGHIFRECPEFKCFRCGESGHYARECAERRRTEEEMGEEVVEEENGRDNHDGEGGQGQTEVLDKGEEDMRIEEEEDPKTGGKDVGGAENTSGADNKNANGEGGEKPNPAAKQGKENEEKDRGRLNGHEREEENGQPDLTKIFQRFSAKRKAEKDKEREERKGPKSGM